MIGPRIGRILLGVALAFGCTQLWSGIAVADVPEIGIATLVDASGEPLAGGGSRTAFGIELSGKTECQGDSADANYRVNSYVVPESLTPTDIAFNGLGPTPEGHGTHDTFRQPLYDVDTAFFVSIQTANAERPGDPGTVLPLPLFDFDIFGPGDLPAGRYHLGIACTLFNEVTRAWDVQIDVVDDPADEPAGLAWSVAGFEAADESSFLLTPVALGALAALGTTAVLIRRRYQPERVTTSRRNP